MNEEQLLRICNWNITHNEDKDMNEVDQTRHYDETHGICEDCDKVVRAELAELFEARAKDQR